VDVDVKSIPVLNLDNENKLWITGIMSLDKPTNRISFFIMEFFFVLDNKIVTDM